MSNHFSPTQKIFTLILFVGAVAPQASAQTSEPATIRTLEDSRQLFLKQSPDAGNDADGETARFERWEYRMTPRLLKGGVLPRSGILLEETEKYYSARSKKSGGALLIVGGEWKSVGPTSFVAPGGTNGGTGRVNVIRFHPRDTTVLFVGTPDGGVWKSEGDNWRPLTDKIPSLGVSDIAIDPFHPDTIYIATGDAKDAGMYGNPYSYGVMKTTDGGYNWTQTGLSFNVSERILIPRVVVSPMSSNVIFAGVYGGDNRGIQKSTDAGATWTKKDGGSIYDIQLCPTNPLVVYASGYGNFRRSTDGGDTWSSISGMPTYVGNNVSRTAIGVTAADPNIVYVLYISHSTNQIHSLYKSTDKGLNFTRVFDSTKTLPCGNYGEYNLILAVSPVDPNVVVIGEQTLAKSTNGGASWVSMGSGIHWDNHAFLFTPKSGTVCYSGNDGGIYRTTNFGAPWQDLSKGLAITQYYRIGSSAERAGLFYTGAQDNGIHRYDETMWSHALSGADGGECLVDYSDENIVYMEWQSGNLFRSDDGGYSTASIAPDNNGHWITPYIIHPKDPETIYVAYRNVYRSHDRGETWEAISGKLAGNDNIKSLALAESNDSVMYAGTYIKLFKTTNSGINWTDITAGSPTGDTAALTYICVSPTDPKKIWLTFSGFTDHQHVYSSTDGGTTWKNITGTLPNVPVNTIVYEKGSNDGVYIGTDIGVFYRDSSMSDWEPFTKGLPNVSVTELEILQKNEIIRAATFGRGVWQSPLRSLAPPAAPKLISPADDSAGVPLTPTFVWQSIPHITKYNVIISLYPSGKPVTNFAVAAPDTTFYQGDLLEPGTKYQWQITPENEAGYGTRSELWHFTTAGQNDVNEPITLQKQTFSVYPNPAKRIITISSNGSISGARIEVCDLLGNVSCSLIPAEGLNSMKINVSTLSSGTYFVRVIGKDFRSVLPLAIEK